MSRLDEKNVKLSEYQSQCLFVEYLEILKSQGKIFMFTAIPNNTWTPSWGQKIKNKKAGLNPGFPDLLIVLMPNIICIEMKVKPNKTTVEQQAWIKALNECGIGTFVCYGYEEAKQTIDNYL